MSISTRKLCDLFLLVGIVGLPCMLFLHTFGAGNPSLPISIEYSDGNPLAIIVVLCTLLAACIAAILYWRIANRAESLLMTCSSICLGLIAITSHSTLIHHCALFIGMVSMTLVPNIHVLRDPEIGLGTIAFVTLIFSTSIVLAIMAALPNSPFGLGIAERVWLVVNYISNAWMLNVVNADTQRTV